MKFLKTIAPAALSELWEKVSGNIVPKDTSANVGIGTDSPTSPLQISYTGGDLDSGLRLVSTASDNFNWITEGTNANLTADESLVHMFGQALNTNNAGYIGFKFSSAGSASNQVNIGLFNAGNLLSVAAGGDVTVSTGNLVIGTAGKGIDFSNQTPAAGMTSELLDHYEEGTWTAALTGTTASTLPNTTGYYTRIGNQVHVQWYSGSMTLGSSSGNAIISGLPFTTRSDSDSYAIFQYLHGNAVDGNSPGGFLGINSTLAYFVDAGSTNTATYIDGSGKYIMFSATYTVAT